MTNESRDRTSVEEFLADVEEYIDEFFRSKLPLAFTSRVRWSPPTDVYETEDEMVVTMAIPGTRIEDINVQFAHGTLTIRGMRREPCSGRRRYHTMEIPVGPFGRRVRILRAIDEDSISIAYVDGLLRITLCKVRTQRVDVPIE